MLLNINNCYHEYIFTVFADYRIKKVKYILHMDSKSSEFNKKPIRIHISFLKQISPNIEIKK